MSTLAKNTRATIVPCLMYRDAAAAIDWLCKTFGFERHAVYPAEDGTIMHAELTFGNGMIMCGTKKETPYSRNIKQPDEIGGCETQSPYVIVADADAVYARAKEAAPDRPRHQNRRLRRTRILLSRSGRAPLELRHIRFLACGVKLNQLRGASPRGTAANYC